MAWLSYVRASAFRELASAEHQVDWSTINVQLYNFHTAGTQLRSHSPSSGFSLEPTGKPTSRIFCRSWNVGHCVAPNPQHVYHHACSSCSGHHPLSLSMHDPGAPRMANAGETTNNYDDRRLGRGIAACGTIGAVSNGSRVLS